MVSRPLRPRCPVPSARRALTLVEVMVAMAIFVFGVVALLNFFPLKVRTGADAAELTEAALLAQLKAEEVRRDNHPDSVFFLYLRSLTEPTPPEGIPFEQNRLLRYAFSGRSVVDAIDNPGVPEDDFGVPRIIVFENITDPFPDGVVYELRFEN